MPGKCPAVAYICCLMKKQISVLVIALCMGLLTSCKEKKEDPKPEPEPPKKGTINFRVTTYDSLGDVRSDHSGVKVSLVENGKTAMTDATGSVSFSDLEYGMYTPVLEKFGFDGPKTTVQLNQPTRLVELPYPQYSNYYVGSFKGKAYSASDMYVSFNLGPFIMPGDSAKIAIIASTTSDLSISKFRTADLIKVFYYEVTDHNISKLPGLSAMVKQLDSLTPFYVSAVPVAFGIYNSNLLDRPQLLGYSPDYPGNVTMIKNWKN